MLPDAPETRRAIGQRMRECRCLRNMHQSDLADAVGVEQTKVSAWERGTRALRIEEAMKAAEVLGTTVGYLVGEQPLPKIGAWKSDERGQHLAC